MPPFSVGFAHVQARVRDFRHRLNAFGAQDGLYRGGTVVVVAMVVKLVVDARHDQSSLGMTFATLLALAGIFAGIAIGHRRWLSVEEAVHLLDRRGGLEDRLTTLLSHRTGSPILKHLLVQQLLQIAPRWELAVVAPRRVPRSIFVFAGSVLTMIAVAYFTRPPAIPTSPLAALSGGGTLQDRYSWPDRSADSNADGIRQHGGSSLYPSRTGETGLSSGTVRNNHGASPNSTSQQVTVAPQTSLAHAPASPMGVHSARRSNPAGATPAFEANGRAPKEPTPGSLNAHDDTRTSTRSQPQASKPDSRSGSRNPRGDTPGGGSSSDSRNDQPPTALYGRTAPLTESASPARNLPVNLAVTARAATGSAPPQLPDQHVHPIERDVGAPSLRPSAEHLIPDAPIYKPEIAPDYEPLVRRIFSRDDE